MGCLALLGGITLVPGLFTAVASATGSATAGAVAVAAVPLVGIAATVWRSRRTDPAPVDDTGTPRTPPAADPEVSWRAARERFTGVQAEYARLECDPLEVLRLPALTDVSVPSTARFIDAFAAAQALLTDHYPGPRTGDEFADAADAGGRARAELGRLDSAGVVHVPLPARAALDAASRRELSP